jgi:hypothetical protein
MREFQVSGFSSSFGFQVSGFGFRVSGFGFQVLGSRFGFQDVSMLIGNALEGGLKHALLHPT